MDKYDEAIEYLVERPEEVGEAWTRCRDKVNRLTPPDGGRGEGENGDKYQFWSFSISAMR